MNLEKVSTYLDINTAAATFNLPSATVAFNKVSMKCRLSMDDGRITNDEWRMTN